MSNSLVILDSKHVAFLSVVIFLDFFISAMNVFSRDILGNRQDAFFIENKGQWHEDVYYLCRLNGLDVWITKYGLNLTYYKILSDDITSNATERLKQNFHYPDLAERSVEGHRIILKFDGAQKKSYCEGYLRQKGYFNYINGDQRFSQVGLYKEVWVRNIYPGIDVRYYFEGRFLRYDFVVHPGADPSIVRLKFYGQYSDSIKDKNIHLTTRFGEVLMSGLNCYQKNITISSSIFKGTDYYAFVLAPYDSSETLIIDPLIYSSFLGGIGADGGRAMDIDNLGNVYITGITSSPDYDVTAGAFQTIPPDFGFDQDIFVTKLNSNDYSLVYSTYLGGLYADVSMAMAVNQAGEIYVTGWTNSINFPVTSGAFNTSFNGGMGDIFLTKLSSDGSSLVFSTFIGGSGFDVAYDLIVDNNGYVYIGGSTESYDYPTSAFAYQSYNQGNVDCCISKFSPDGTSLVYSSYFGGTDYDQIHGMDVDSDGNLVATGFTMSADFDVTPDAFQPLHAENGGNYDVFVSKFNNSGSLDYSTFLGGSCIDWGRDVVIHNSDVYIVGFTCSSDFDVLPGSLQSTLNGSWDMFISKFNIVNFNLIASTYFGGSADDMCYAVTDDILGRIYLTGYTSSNNFLTTNDAYQTTNNGSDDVFVVVLDSTLNTLLFSTYLGGSYSDQAYSIKTYNGNIFITGETPSSDFDVTPGSFESIYNGGWFDAFVSKMCYNQAIYYNLLSDLTTINQKPCLNAPMDSVIYFVYGVESVSFLGLPSGVSGALSGNNVIISGSPTGLGTFNYSIILSNQCSSDTIFGSVEVLDCSAGLSYSSDTGNFHLYPNPAKNFISVHSDFIPGQLIVCRPDGQVVLEKRLLHYQDILSLDHLANGLYYVIYRDDCKLKIQSAKFIKI